MLRVKFVFLIYSFEHLHQKIPIPLFVFMTFLILIFSTVFTWRTSVKYFRMDAVIFPQKNCIFTTLTYRAFKTWNLVKKLIVFQPVKKFLNQCSNLKHEGYRAIRKDVDKHIITCRCVLCGYTVYNPRHPYPDSVRLLYWFFFYSFFTDHLLEREEIKIKIG